MQNFPPLRAVRALLALGLLATTACDAPDDAYVPSGPQLSEFSTASLVSCPTAQTTAHRGRVYPVLGGVVALASNQVVVPAAALLGSAEIEIQVPASRHMLIELKANGQDHWQFLAPVTVTIDYSRCAIGPLDPPVTVWHVDPDSGELLEHMGGVDNRLLKTITFVTDHFSGYAIAN